MPVENDAGIEVSDGVKKLRQTLSNFDTEEGRRKGLAFKPQPSDVFIVTSPKAGTTWVQQIVHQLRSRGSMDYEEISMEIPFVEVAYDVGQDLEAPQNFEPRAFKTHLWRPHCPAGARYLVVVREPSDVALSFFRFFEGWFFQPGEVQPDEFVREFWLARGEAVSEMQNAGFFHHLLSWWPHRHDRDVLWLFFEDLKQDLAGQVDRIAEFLALPNDSEELRKVATDQSTFTFMSEHKSHFDERLTRIHRNGPCGLSPDAGSDGGKVRVGEVGGARKGGLSVKTVEAIEARWKEVVSPVTGFATYEVMRKAFHEELAAKGGRT